MEAKRLPLNVEWENGVISNEVQIGVKPKCIILNEHEKMVLDGQGLISPEKTSLDAMLMGQLSKTLEILFPEREAEFTPWSTAQEKRKFQEGAWKTPVLIL